MATKKELYAKAWREWQKSYEAYLQEWANEMRKYLLERQANELTPIVLIIPAG